MGQSGEIKVSPVVDNEALIKLSMPVLIWLVVKIPYDSLKKVQID